jgi:hypothetical protein
VDGHGAADFLVLLRELGDLGFAGDVFLAVDFDLRFDAAAEDFVEGRQFCEEGRLREGLHQGELARLEPGIDDLDDVHVGLLFLLVVGLAGHGDVMERGRLGERGADFAVVAQPGFEVGGGGGFSEVDLELIEDRRELGGVGEVDGFGEKLAGYKMSRLHQGLTWHKAGACPSATWARGTKQ